MVLGMGATAREIKVYRPTAENVASRYGKYWEPPKNVGLSRMMVGACVTIVVVALIGIAIRVLSRSHRTAAGEGHASSPGAMLVTWCRRRGQSMRDSLRLLRSNLADQLQSARRPPSCTSRPGARNRNRRRAPSRAKYRKGAQRLEDEELGVQAADHAEEADEVSQRTQPAGGAAAGARQLMRQLAASSQRGRAPAQAGAARIEARKGAAAAPTELARRGGRPSHQGGKGGEEEGSEKEESGEGEEESEEESEGSEEGEGEGEGEGEEEDEGEEEGEGEEEDEGEEEEASMDEGSDSGEEDQASEGDESLAARERSASTTASTAASRKMATVVKKEGGGRAVFAVAQRHRRRSK